MFGAPKTRTPRERCAEFQNVVVTLAWWYFFRRRVGGAMGKASLSPAPACVFGAVMLR